MIPSRLEQLARQAEAVVRETGALIRSGRERPADVRHKGRIDLVTATDLAVEQVLKERLAALLPDSDFLAEESASATRPGALTWIIDPLDGTTNFAHGLPFVATSVALWAEGRVVLGLINLPLLDEFFSAVRGQGARLNGRPIRVSATAELIEALVATGFPYDNRPYLPSILAQLEVMLRAAQGVRRPGAAALDLAYVACGRYDGFYEYGLNAWDTAAGLLLVEEAGGRVTAMDGESPYELGARSILASNGLLHAELGRLLSGAERF